MAFPCQFGVVRSLHRLDVDSAAALPPLPTPGPYLSLIGDYGLGTPPVRHYRRPTGQEQLLGTASALARCSTHRGLTAKGPVPAGEVAGLRVNVGGPRQPSCFRFYCTAYP